MYAFSGAYILFVIVMCYCSLNKKLKKLNSKGISCFFWCICIVLALFMAVFYWLIVLILTKGNAMSLFKIKKFSELGDEQNAIFAAIFLLILNWLMPIILNPIRVIKKLDRFIFGFVIYLLSTTAMMNLLGIYSVCNIDDISWGNRPEKARALMSEKEKKEDDLTQSYVSYKWKFLFWYIFGNIIVAAAIIAPYLLTNGEIDTINYVGIGLALWIGVKLIFAFLWYILYYLKNGYVLLQYKFRGCIRYLINNF